MKFTSKMVVAAEALTIHDEVLLEPPAGWKSAMGYNAVAEASDGLQLQAVIIIPLTRKADKLLALSVRTPATGWPRNLENGLNYSVGNMVGSVVKMAQGGKIDESPRTAKNDALLTGLAEEAHPHNAKATIAVASASLTKAQWKDKMAHNFRYFPGTPVIGSAQQFQQIMGKPDRTQTVGDQAYWYYQCSDGTIQLVMNVLNLQMAGLIQADVNDY